MDAAPAPTNLHVHRVDHAGAESARVALRSTYVDDFWIPLVGSEPVAVLRLLHRLVGASNRSGIAVQDLAEAVGLRAPGGPRLVVGALEALQAEGALVVAARHRVELPATLPRLAPHQVARLPLRLRDLHQLWLGLVPYGDEQSADLGGPSDGIATLRSREVALLPTADDDPGDDGAAIRRWRAIVDLATEVHHDLLRARSVPAVRQSMVDLERVRGELSTTITAAQDHLRRRGAIPSTDRLALTRAAAAVIDWLVASGGTGADLPSAGRSAECGESWDES